MVLIKIIFLIPLFFIFACESNSEIAQLEKEAGANYVPNGSELYSDNCSSCHGIDGKLGGAGAKDLTKSKLSDQEIEKILEKGKNAMPPMKEILGSDKNKIAVVEYIKRMRK